jgi:NTP pyrophosphatase (non-canonical NTP hydrolase)
MARAICKGDRDHLVHDFSDVLAWLASRANLLEVDLEEGGCLATPTDAEASIGA